MNKKAPQTIRELFEGIGQAYDDAEKEFRVFRSSPIGKWYKSTLDDFIHEARRSAGKVSFHLIHGPLPERGKTSMIWVAYHNTKTNIGIMNLIVELAKGNKQQTRKDGQLVVK